MIKEGKIPVPYHLAHRDEALRRGINAPFNQPLFKGRNRTNSQLTASSVRALAILVTFSDNPSQVSPVFFDSLLFGANGHTLRNYYNEVSYGSLDIVTVNFPNSVGWQTMPQTYSYYVNGQNGFGSYPRNAQRLTEDAVAAVNPIVDFSNYDNDGDGYVDALFIIHAGQGAEFTGNPNHIWSHAWVTSSPIYVDGVRVYHYSTEPEYWRSPGDMTCGVYAHEAGHAVFGLPDLYDYDYDSEGLGEWSLMAGGSWNGYYGNSPSHPDAWCRYKMGFLSPIEIHKDTLAVDIPAVKNEGVVYKLWKGGSSSNEYFLVENRQKIGYDAALPGSGLCIYHVDESQSGNDNQWYPGHSSSGHYKVALEQADGRWDLEKNYNGGDAGDPYPGSSDNRTFDDNSTPDSKNYLGEQTYVSVSNISNSQLIMKADFTVEIVPPEINVVPSSVAVTVSPGDTALRHIEIQNTGMGSLHYKIESTTLQSFNLPLKNKESITRYGGPDSFGYFWVDSDEPSGAVFDWIDITNIGTPVTLGDDESSEFISLDFDFPFYGNIFNQISISSNGWVSFSDAGDPLPISPLPSMWSPRNLISIMGADMYPTGTCYYYSDIVNNRFIVEYFNWGLLEVQSPDYTMEIIIQKDGKIKLQYLRMDGNVTGYVTGIQNSSRDIGLMIGYGETYLKDSLAVEIKLLPEWLTVFPIEGIVPPGESRYLTLNFNSDEVLAGDHTGSFIITSNDLDEPTTIVDIEMNVPDEPNIKILNRDINFGQIYLGTSKVETLIVRNRGTQNLSITNITTSDTCFKPDTVNFLVTPKGEHPILLTFTPDTVGNILDSLIIVSNDPQEPYYVLFLNAEVIHRPVLVSSPDSFNYTLVRGQMDSAIIHLENHGLGELHYDVSIQPVNYILGDTSVLLNSLSSTRGNIYTFNDVTILQSFKTFLEINSSIQLTFTVYEASKKSGPYSLIYSGQKNVSIGKRFYESGHINVKLQPGKFYYIAVSNSGQIIFYRQTRTMPIDTLFGRIESGANGYYPPPATLTPFIYSYMLWNQELSLAPDIIEGTLTDSGVIASMNQKDIQFKINSSVKYGTHQTGFLIKSNDPFLSEKIIPLSLTVKFRGIDVQSDWNLVSVPFNTINMSKDYLFPTSTSMAFGFQKGYSISESLQIGSGYWLKFPAGDTIEIEGLSIQRDTISVRRGWNLIGSLSYPILVNTIISTGPGIVASNFIGFSKEGGYFNEDTLQPGKAYWVRMSDSAGLVLDGDITIQMNKTQETNRFERLLGVLSHDDREVAEISSIKFTDARGNAQTIYFDTKNDKIDVDNYILPPIPPADVFDVRFASQRNIEIAKENNQVYSIMISGGVFPLNVKWKLKNDLTHSVLEFDDNKVYLDGQDSVKIFKQFTKVFLRILDSYELPKEFFVAQNYPNPFNPSTIINYQLPIDSWVTLKVYNILGQEVATLIDGFQDAGYKSVEWNSSSSGEGTSSGVYFYRLDAMSVRDPNNSYHQIRKMILMK